MGLEVPDIAYVFGNDCDCCENPGGLWDDGETPRYVKALFWDVINGPSPLCDWHVFPNGQIFLLEQHVLEACLWTGAFPSPQGVGHINWMPCIFGGSNINYGIAGWTMFQGGSLVPCLTEFSNSPHMPFPLCWTEGRGKVWWKEISAFCCIDLGLQTPYGTMYEETGTEDGLVSLNLANIRTPTSVQILFDPQVD